MEWLDWVLFNKNKSFLLPPAPGRGGGRVGAVHFSARLDPGTSRRRLAAAGAGGEQFPAQLQQEQGFHGSTQWLMLQGASGGHLVLTSAPAPSLCLHRFLILARMESEQPPRATRARAPAAAKKGFPEVQVVFQVVPMHFGHC